MLENWIPEKVPLSKLLKNENNPRTITKAKLQKLIESLQGVGIFKPIICTWDYKIIGGTQRNIAILELMPASFEVYIMRPPRPLSQEEYDKVLLLDNAHSGQWDMDALANNYSLEMIEDAGIDVTIPPVEVLPTEGLTDEDDVPDVKEPIVRKGDLWLLGDHKLLCGDSTLIDDLEKLMQESKADCWLADPPFGVSYMAKNAAVNGGIVKNQTGKEIQSDTKTVEELCPFWRDVASNAYAFTTNEASNYWCACQGSDKMMMMMMMMDEAGWNIRHELIWVKSSFVFGRSDYHYRHEPIIYGWKKKGKHIWYGDRKQDSVLEIDRPSKSDLHPTTKPVKLYERFISNSTSKGQIVLESFGGSGSSLLACESLGRKCYGIEIDPHYCTVILNRWRNFTGKEPILESTGQTLKEIEAVSAK